jgi:hypothetical protein
MALSVPKTLSLKAGNFSTSATDYCKGCLGFAQHLQHGFGKEPPPPEIPHDTPSDSASNHKEKHHPINPL